LTIGVIPRARQLRIPRIALGPGGVLAAIAFAALFARPASLLVRDWLNDPDAGHGLLLVPVAIWIAWRSGIRKDATPNPVLGVSMLAFAVLIRYASGLAAELFTMRMSMVLAAGGLTVYYAGVKQLLRWWLPFALVVLSVPLPAIVLNAIALPLQFKASQIGTSLLEWRHVPVRLTGNVIRIPGHELFVAAACSGLRSLTALISLGLLLGHMMLVHPISRALLLLVSIPVAIVINGVRVFLTAFLIFFVSPSLGEGFMHITEGWLLFLVALAALAALTWVATKAEQLVLHRSAP
jgi:exosortase